MITAIHFANRITLEPTDTSTDLLICHRNGDRVAVTLSEDEAQVLVDQIHDALRALRRERTDNAKRLITHGKPNADRRTYPAPAPLVWTERANGYRAEHHGQLVYVRQMARGWCWTWSHVGGNGGFATAADAMADVDRALVSPAAKTVDR